MTRAAFGIRLRRALDRFFRREDSSQHFSDTSDLHSPQDIDEETQGALNKIEIETRKRLDRHARMQAFKKRGQ